MGVEAHEVLRRSADVEEEVREERVAVDGEEAVLEGVEAVQPVASSRGPHELPADLEATRKELMAGRKKNENLIFI